MDLSIIIVNWNVINLLDACLQSIFETIKNLRFEVFVVDNNSSDGSVQMVQEKYPKVLLIANRENLGFAKANNQAFARSSGKYILYLNPDTKVLPKAIESMVDFMDKHPETGALGPKLLFPDGSLQLSCRRFPTLNLALWQNLFLSKWFPNSSLEKKHRMQDWEHNEVREVDQPMGAALIVRRQALDEVGIMDEGYFMFFDEVDLCYRLKRKGWKVFFLPDSKIIHHIGKSVEKNPSMGYHYFKSLYLFAQKHLKQGHPFKFFILSILFTWNMRLGGMRKK